MLNWPCRLISALGGKIEVSETFFAEIGTFDFGFGISCGKFWVNLGWFLLLKNVINIDQRSTGKKLNSDAILVWHIKQYNVYGSF